MLDLPADRLVERRLHRAQEEWAGQPNLFDDLTLEAAFQGLDVDRNVRELGHEPSPYCLIDPTGLWQGDGDRARFARVS